jgi:miniconductance mechanosensitive channel
MLDRLADVHPLLPLLALIGALLLAAIVAHFVVRRALIAFMHMLASRSSLQWNQALQKHKVFHRITHVIPAIVVYLGIAAMGAGDDAEPGEAAGQAETAEQTYTLISTTMVDAIQNVAMAYVALMVTLAVTAALAAGNDIYAKQPIARERPLKGIVQVAQIIVYIIGAVFVISHLIDREPWVLLSGFGAMTAVLLLVFKDTILGLVASLQLTANEMVRVGDWIEMPACGADGDVIDVALHTVKVQNWDKTITTIPTYKLISESFRNWRGMSESGGRRIKRPIYIDQQSIRFLTDEEIKRFERFALLRAHFERKRAELEAAAESLGEDAKDEVNRRRLTNVGVFRSYVRNYLGAHPSVNHDMTLLVRQLHPGSDGLPIEIYCFAGTTEWLPYEDVQSDIFDHILAILPEFGLRLFQKPTGADLGQLGNLMAMAREG